LSPTKPQKTQYPKDEEVNRLQNKIQVIGKKRAIILPISVILSYELEDHNEEFCAIVFSIRRTNGGEVGYSDSISPVRVTFSTHDIAYQISDEIDKIFAEYYNSLKVSSTLMDDTSYIKEKK